MIGTISTRRRGLVEGRALKFARDRSPLCSCAEIDAFLCQLVTRTSSKSWIGYPSPHTLRCPVSNLSCTRLCRVGMTARLVGVGVQRRHHRPPPTHDPVAGMEQNSGCAFICVHVPYVLLARDLLG